MILLFGHNLLFLYDGYFGVALSIFRQLENDTDCFDIDSRQTANNNYCIKQLDLLSKQHLKRKIIKMDYYRNILPSPHGGGWISRLSLVKNCTGFPGF